MSKQAQGEVGVVVGDTHDTAHDQPHPYPTTTTTTTTTTQTQSKTHTRQMGLPSRAIPIPHQVS